jgi:hypothetical protein
VYGITTGFGKFARTVIDCDKLEYVSYNSEYPLYNINLSTTQKWTGEGDVTDVYIFTFILSRVKVSHDSN